MPGVIYAAVKSGGGYMIISMRRRKGTISCLGLYTYLGMLERKKGGSFITEKPADITCPETAMIKLNINFLIFSL